MPIGIIQMEHFRIYLKSELGKLANQDMAASFLSSAGSALFRECGLPTMAARLKDSFSSQEKVDSFVNSLSDKHLKNLTESCDRDCRKNGVFTILSRHRDWRLCDAPVDMLDVKQAEPALAYIFQRNEFHLRRIAEDNELWTKPPYVRWDLKAKIPFPTCLGQFKLGRWQLFDGIHRAILVAKQGGKVIPVYYYEN